ncbi:ribose-phosphate pyrophosphokinase 1, partial [Coemansia sp. RSA 2675]
GGIDVSKDVDFPRWYQQVLTRSDMLEYYDVSGCYIVRPLAYFVWQQIQEFFDAGIRSLGVKNCYFPMFVSSKVLEREKDHIEGFAPEVAWVTRAGSTELAEPIAIRPTSETVMYPYFAKWIRSHRDLPLKINQWCSVVRWEFKNPQPFLRTREFLWQEGHCAYMTEKEAMVEVYDVLTLYRRIYEELLAVPVIEGEKSSKEKFAGGVATTTVEGFIAATGRGIQGATSHYLGQNFSKMLNIVVQDPEDSGADRPKLHVHQTSWGLSTRTIGVMVMTHGDDQGLVMPPRVAETQVIIIPCGLTAKHSDEDRRAVSDACLNVEARLRAVGVRAESDLRELYTPGQKFNHWEVRGVPLRVEIGPKDLEKNSVLTARRDTFAKAPMSLDGLESSVQLMLLTIQNDMLAKARKTFDERVKIVLDWSEFVPVLNSKCLALIPWCEREVCEDQIKTRSSRDSLGDEPEDEKAPSMGAKSLCLPSKQPTNPPIVHGETKCIQCGENAKRYALFGRSY